MSDQRLQVSVESFDKNTGDGSVKDDRGNLFRFNLREIRLDGLDSNDLRRGTTLIGLFRNDALNGLQVEDGE